MGVPIRTHFRVPRNVIANFEISCHWSDLLKDGPNAIVGKSCTTWTRTFITVLSFPNTLANRLLETILLQPPAPGRISLA